tara:strand:- start:74 stop:271 length:198 start_codon:yes stop_codon:yes gene_type:complete
MKISIIINLHDKIIIIMRRNNNGFTLVEIIVAVIIAGIIISIAIPAYRDYKSRMYEMKSELQNEQ